MVTLTAPRRKSLGLLVLCTPFVTVCTLMLLSGDTAGIAWLGVIIFGVGWLLMLGQLVAPSRLVITPSEIKFSHLGRQWSRDLARCSAFEVWRNPADSSEWVVFDHPDDANRWWAARGRQSFGRTSALPHTYGVSPAGLAAMLNEAQRTSVVVAGDSTSSSAIE